MEEREEEEEERWKRKRKRKRKRRRGIGRGEQKEEEEKGTVKQSGECIVLCSFFVKNFLNCVKLYTTVCGVWCAV